MPKSARTRIIEALVGNLQKIQAGHQIPNLSTGVSHKFLSTVRSVNRKVAALNDDQKPALYVVDPAEQGKHLLADILAQTMQLTVAGLITAPQQKNQTPNRHIVTMLDDLIDDTRAVLVSDPKLGGLARRCRVPRIEADTSIDTDNVAFGAIYEVDYIETVDSGEGTPVTLPPMQPITSKWALQDPNCEQSYTANVMNAMFNAYRRIPGLVWVERPRIWPIPLEQVSARYTPGVYFHETNEAFDYFGADATKKRVTVSTVLLAVETDEAKFDAAIDYWVAGLKNCLGTYADLWDVVLTVDVQSIRTDRSEYPVVLIEMDSQLMYVQTFKFN